MRKPMAGKIGSYIQNRTLKKWERLAEYARTAPLSELRDIRTASRVLGQRVGTVNHIAEGRLIRPVIGSNAMELPPSTDWSHRPDLWAGPIAPSGFAPAKNETHIGHEVTLYHDCKRQMLSVRQVRNTDAVDLAPFGLQMDVFTFEGSFLSLVIKAPDDVTKGLTKKHILRLSLRAESERPLEMSARMNLKHGPNTEQVSKEIDLSLQESAVEFDLAYVPFTENRAEHIWFDLFFDSPSMNKTVLRDLTLSRHIRSSL
jgi:uncharacterized protein DUF6478